MLAAATMFLLPLSSLFRLSVDGGPVAREDAERQEQRERCYQARVRHGNDGKIPSIELRRYDHREKRGFFQKYIFEIIKKRFEFKIRRSHCYEFIEFGKEFFVENGSFY
ncbi:hypothetical protein Tco_1344084 [Tanacetum coccineum]